MQTNPSPKNNSYVTDLSPLKRTELNAWLWRAAAHFPNHRLTDQSPMSEVLCENTKCSKIWVQHNSVYLSVLVSVTFLVYLLCSSLQNIQGPWNLSDMSEKQIVNIHICPVSVLFFYWKLVLLSKRSQFWQEYVKKNYWLVSTAKKIKNWKVLLVLVFNPSSFTCEILKHLLFSDPPQLNCHCRESDSEEKEWKWKLMSILSKLKVR